MVVRLNIKIQGICFRISKGRNQEASPQLQSNPAYNSIKDSQKNELYENNECNSSFNSDTSKFSSEESCEAKQGNRIMVVVDGSQEAKGALQWALSHTVQKEDTVILLYIVKSSKSGLKKTESDADLKECGFLYSMKSVCQSKRPGVQVEVVAITGKEKEKGAVIVKQAKEKKVNLLILGHKKRCKAWRFWMRWTGRKRSVVDYCIQNADCMTIAVRRKSRKLGGYLITTKRHKNFWLLA